MKSLLLLGHMGLGDHLLTNGLIRYLSKSYEVNILSKKVYKNTLNYMFSDIESIINILSIEDDIEAIKYFFNYSKYYDETLKLGNFTSNFMLNAKTFDESFYLQANVPYEYRWEYFKAPTNNLLQIPKCEYIFLHEDKERNYFLNKNYINEKYQVYLPTNNNTFFSYYNIIKNAKEIHCMDSSFSAYIDHLPELYEKPKFIHRYVRNNTLNPYYKNNWKIIYE